MGNKHTPGPWAVAAFNVHQVIAIHDGPNEKGQTFMDGKHQHTVCTTSDEYDKGRFEEQSANAKLIALVPEMLAALQAQETAENKNANCPDCDGIGDWAECGRCSELFGDAIDLRHAVLLKVPA